MVLLILIFLLLFLLSLGYYFARLVIYPKIVPFQQTYEHALGTGEIIESELKSWPKEELRIRSRFGYDLYAAYFPVDGSLKTVVFSHGITWSLYGMLKYALLLRSHGFNLLLYDLRNHGQSGGTNTSFGYYEKFDLVTIVDWALARLGPGGVVGTFGESLGAATTLQHAAIDSRIAFAIADCPFSDLTDLLSIRIKDEYYLPSFPFIPLANLFTRILAGWWFKDASPIRCMTHIEAPVLLVHGKADTYIPPRMSIDLYRAKTRGCRRLYLAPDAGHAHSLLRNPIEYAQKLDAFLREISLA